MAMPRDFGCQAKRDAILKEMESWTSMHHDDDKMMAGIALQDLCSGYNFECSPTRLPAFFAARCQASVELSTSASSDDQIVFCVYIFDFPKGVFNLSCTM